MSKPSDAAADPFKNALPETTHLITNSEMFILNRALFARTTLPLRRALGSVYSRLSRPLRRQKVLVAQMGARGLMASINIIVQIAALAERDGRQIVVRGEDNLYIDPNKSGEPWLYYFEPVFPGARVGPKPTPARFVYKDQMVLKANQALAPRMVKGIAQGLELPKDRHLGHRLLSKYVRLNDTSQRSIQSFAEQHLTGPYIGLHIRGPGRNHGGAAELRQMLDPSQPVPFEHYFRATDAALAEHPDAAIFACSDSQMVIDRVVERYGDRVVVYPAQRSDFGEMHENHPANKGQVFSPFQLGLDVVTESHLLAGCCHFVHGNSNVANYVLCRAPDTPSTYVYAEVEPQLRALAEAGKLTKVHGKKAP